MADLERNAQNMQLDRPRLLLSESGSIRRWCFYMVLLGLGGLGAWGSLITAFELPVMPAALVAMGLLCCAFTVWRQVDTRKRWWSVTLVGWVLWILGAVFLFDQALHGGVRALNAMLDAYSNRLNYDLPVLALPSSAGAARPSPEEECTAFFSLLLYPFYWAISRMLVHRRNSLGPFALTGFLLVLPLSFSILPAGWAFAGLLMFWSMLLLTAPVLGGREGLLGHRERYKASGAASARPGTLLILPVLALCMVGIYLAYPAEGYARPKLVDELRYTVENGFGTASYMRGGQGNSNRQVQLNTLGGRSYSGETALRVKFEWQPGSGESVFPHKEYLKSFVGSVYTGKSWERLSPESREALQEVSFRPQNQIDIYGMEMFLPGYDLVGNYSLSVQNLMANPRCVFIPCGLSSTPEELAGYELEFVDDSYVNSGNFFTGSREYSLEAFGVPKGYNYFGRIAHVIADREYGARLYSNLGDASAGGSVVNVYANYSNDYPLWDELFTDLKNQGITAVESGQDWEWDLWTVEGAAGKHLFPEELALAREIEAYNRFVYETYTQVPEELADYLRRFQEAYDLNPYRDIRGYKVYTADGEERISASFLGGQALGSGINFGDGAVYFAGQIQKMFKEYFSYSLNPSQPGPGEDFVEFFLDSSHEGYCVHFATAAVMLLRSAGYPARYAEGYVVPSFQEGWVDVPDYNAHAWVEVYCGGTGWVPVEVTPASIDNPAVYYDAAMPTESAGQSAVQDTTPRPRPTVAPRRELDLDDLVGPTLGPQASHSPKPEASDGYNPAEDPSFLPVVLGGIGLLACAAAIVLLARQLRKRALARDLRQADRNQAALRAYGHLLKLYEWEAFCGQREPPPERWKELAEKARFGRGMLNKDELEELVMEIDRLKGKLKEQLPRWQKVRCWIAGLI